MVEGSVEGIAGFLEAIAGWGSVAWTELWSSLKTPSNAPVFLGSLIKSSLGPVLAFLLSLCAFRKQERWKEDKEIEALRLIVLIEVESNVERLVQLQKETHIDMNEIATDALRTSMFSRFLVIRPFLVIRKRFLNIDPAKVARAFTPEELNQLEKHYKSLETLEVHFSEMETSASNNELSIAEVKVFSAALGWVIGYGKSVAKLLSR